MAGPGRVPEPEGPVSARVLYGSFSLLLVLMLVAGFGLGVLLLRDDQPEPPSRAGAEASPGSEGADESDPPAPLPTALPTRPPSDVIWRQVGPAVLPFSRTSGPLRSAGYTAAGYVRTPVGALLAATQIFSRATPSSGPASFEPTIRDQFIPSTDRDRLLVGLRAAASPPPTAPVEPDPGPDPGPDRGLGPGLVPTPMVGYRYRSYTPDAAELTLVRRAPNPRAGVNYVATSVTLLWRDGDWRMVAPVGGSWDPMVRELADLTDLTGLVRWGPPPPAR